MVPHKDTMNGDVADSKNVHDDSKDKELKPRKRNSSSIWKSTSSNIKTSPSLRRLYKYRPSFTSLKWIPANFTYPKLKPVIRSALTAWLSIVLFVIPSVEDTLGQVSLLASKLLLSNENFRPAF